MLVSLPIIEVYSQLFFALSSPFFHIILLVPSSFFPRSSKVRHHIACRWLLCHLWPNLLPNSYCLLCWYSWRNNLTALWNVPHFIFRWRASCSFQPTKCAKCERSVGRYGWYAESDRGYVCRPAWAIGVKKEVLVNVFELTGVLGVREGQSVWTIWCDECKIGDYLSHLACWEWERGCQLTFWGTYCIHSKRGGVP